MRKAKIHYKVGNLRDTLCGRNASLFLTSTNTTLVTCKVCIRELNWHATDRWSNIIK